MPLSMSRCQAQTGCTWRRLCGHHVTCCCSPRALRPRSRAVHLRCSPGACWRLLPARAGSRLQKASARHPANSLVERQAASLRGNQASLNLLVGLFPPKKKVFVLNFKCFGLCGFQTLRVTFRLKMLLFFPFWRYANELFFYLLCL